MYTTRRVQGKLTVADGVVNILNSDFTTPYVFSSNVPMDLYLYGEETERLDNTDYIDPVRTTYHKSQYKDIDINIQLYNSYDDTVIDTLYDDHFRLFTSNCSVTHEYTGSTIYSQTFAQASYGSTISWPFIAHQSRKGKVAFSGQRRAYSSAPTGSSGWIGEITGFLGIINISDDNLTVSAQNEYNYYHATATETAPQVPTATQRIAITPTDTTDYYCIMGDYLINYYDGSNTLITTYDLSTLLGYTTLKGIYLADDNSKFIISGTISATNYMWEVSTDFTTLLATYTIDTTASSFTYRNKEWFMSGYSLNSNETIKEYNLIYYE